MFEGLRTTAKVLVDPPALRKAYLREFHDTSAS